jgi:hypothetical protein
VSSNSPEEAHHSTEPNRRQKTRPTHIHSRQKMRSFSARKASSDRYHAVGSVGSRPAIGDGVCVGVGVGVTFMVAALKSSAAADGSE